MNLPNLESVFTLTWQASLRACVLIIAVLIVQTLAGKRLPARFRYALGILILLRLLMPVTPASSWSVFNLTRHVHPVPAAAPILPSPVPPITIVAPHSIPSLIAASQSSRLSLGQWASMFWLSGGAGFLLAVFWRHRKFAQWVGQLPRATDPRLVELVEQCKIEAGVRRAFRITNAPQGNSAAVFGFLRPCLLLPEGMLDTLDRREARLVLLHELFHIRRRDVLVNWISVLALALHWFNPLAWIAMRRLRADQELACDAAVLGLIEPAERGAYGRTLLKHLHDFSATRMAAGLVPLITSRHNIKRRIIMITEFKNTGGVARILFALLFVALGGLTFTRAADDPKPDAPPSAPQSIDSATPSLGTITSVVTDPNFRVSSVGITPRSDTVPTGTSVVVRLGAPSQTAMTPFPGTSTISTTNALEAFIDEQIQKTIRESYHGHRALLIKSLHEKGMTYEEWRRGQKEYWIDQLKKAIISKDGLHRALPSNNASSQRLKDWDHQRVIAEADYLEYSNVLFYLNRLDPKQLGAALTTAFGHKSDPELIDLAARLQTAKANMVSIKQNYGEQQPVYKTIKEQLEDSEAAYKNKVDAIMAGIKTRVNEDKGFLQLMILRGS